MQIRHDKVSESSDLERTFILVGVIKFLLKSAIDHVSETILSGSRVWHIGQGSGGIELRSRQGLGVEGGGETEQHKEIANEEESRESPPHCGGLSERTTKKEKKEKKILEREREKEGKKVNRKVRRIAEA